MSRVSIKSDIGIKHEKDLLEPELHVVGEIEGASEMSHSHDNGFCSYQIFTGPNWLCVGGDLEGQTQVDYPDENGDLIVWNHPIDVHWYTKTLQGWPRMLLEVWKMDNHGCKDLCGYGFCYLPTQPGLHELEVPIWRPCGPVKEEVYAYFIGGGLHLLDKDVVHLPVKAKEDRPRLFSVTVGKVHLRLDIILRHLQPHSIKAS